MIIRPGVRYTDPSYSVTTPLGQNQKGGRRLTATSETGANTVQAFARGELLFHDVNTLLHTSFNSRTTIEFDVYTIARSRYNCRDRQMFSVDNDQSIACSACFRMSRVQQVRTRREASIGTTSEKRE